MTIFVLASAGRTRIVFPDPAIVVAGEDVSWEFHYDGRSDPSVNPLKWTIYFRNVGPFAEWKNKTIETKPENNPEQRVILNGGVASVEGDHKYGVRLQNAITNGVLSDDDPRLIVRPKSGQPLYGL